MILPVILIMAITPFFMTQAQSGELKAVRQRMIESGDWLMETKAGGGAAAEARKAALGKILELSVLETKTIINKITNSKNSQTFLNVFSDLLDVQLDFQNRLEEIVDPADIKGLAAEFREWREKEYKPLLQSALDFISIAKSETILNMAEARREKIAVDLRRWKSKTAQSEAVVRLLNQARVYLEEARASFTEAQSVFNQSALEKMIFKIRDAYGKFFEISDFLKKSAIKNP
jgi:hypothetical protein